MPDRIVRAKINTSEKVNRLDAPAEVFYRRLINVVDDFGRFDARPTILMSSCFPLRPGKVREPDILRWLAACQSAELIRLYEVDGKMYLELLNLGDRRRAKHSKYPPPPAESGCLSADDNQCRHVTTDVGNRTAMSTEARSEKRDSDARSGGAPPAPPDDPEPDPIVVQVRSFLHNDNRFLWSQKLQDALVDLVRDKGWAWTEKAIDGRATDGDPDPIGTLHRRIRHKGSGKNGAVRERSAVAVPGREDD